MIKCRKLTLEQRIARLEKVLKNEEDAPDFMTPSERNAWAKKNIDRIRANFRSGGAPSSKSLERKVEEWFDDNMGPDMYDSKRAWMSDLRWMSKGSPNGSEADDCCDAVGCDDISAVTNILAKLAKDALNDIKYNKAHGQDSVGRVWIDPWA